MSQTHPHEDTKDEPCFTAYLDGLTKRELFAAMAMQGLLAWQELDRPPEDVAREARIQADALLTELAK